MQTRQRILGILLLLFLIATGCSKVSEPPSASSPSASPKTAALNGHKLVVAGSGTNLPLTAQLAAAYKRQSGAEVELPPSIGSDGAVKAVQEGALELGLISRELTLEEATAGLKDIPYARVGVIFGTHPSTPDDDVSAVDIMKIYQGAKTTWSDGRRIIVLIRNKNDSSNQVLFRAIPGFSAVIETAVAKNLWQMMYHDAEMAEGIRTKPGSFGYTDYTEVKINAGIKVLSVDGIAPTVDAVRDGRYPFSKELRFVYKEPLSDRAKAFIAFCSSPAGRDTITQGGGIPWMK